MLDIKFIREHAEAVKKASIDKHIDIDIDELLDIDRQRRELMSETESLQATKNAVSKEIPSLSPDERKVKILEMQEVDARQAELEKKLKSILERFNFLMAHVPNIPSPETPVGGDDSANVPWSYWSPIIGHVDPKDQAKVLEVPTKFTFPIKDHITLGRDLAILDLEAGVKTAGFRGYYLKNQGALLHYALLWYAVKKLVAKGFDIFTPPTLVREFTLFGSGHFPGSKDEIYQIANTGGEPLYLAGTSEPALLAYFSDTVLDEKELPKKVAGVSQCYRSEVGSYGKDTKGIYRIHEFSKVEQVVICKAEMLEGEKWLEALRETAEELLQELKLPYRVLNICTGDMGAGKYKMYDIETWMPSRESFGETHSDSNLTDWQARRLNIRYKATDGTIKYAYTLNNTAVASPRILIAILENYQQADGSVVIPEVLRPFVGVDVIKQLV